MALDEIQSLPDRVGYLWLKAMTSEAIRISTRELKIPHGEDLENAIQSVQRDPTIGGRLSRKEYEHRIAERSRKWTVEEEGGLGIRLTPA